MLKPGAFLLIASLFCPQSFAAAGFSQFNVKGSGVRSVAVAVWYPTQQTGLPETIGENAAFAGSVVLRNAEPEPGHHPLVLLSHGYGGSWRNLAWLAEAMALQGYIVIAPNHPGTSTENADSGQAQQLWLRPGDLTLAMQEVINKPAIAGKVDSDRIAAAGHSLGGWTVMELAGARFNAEKFITDCSAHSGLSSCRVAANLGINKLSSRIPLAASLRDKRIKAIVTLDTGLARGFTDKSLAKIDLPILVLAAGTDSPALPAQVESGYLAESLPSARVTFAQIAGATHFSFMQLCKPGGETLIEKSAPGEGIVCRDGGSVDRKDLHRLLANKISRFLNAALRYQPQPVDKPLASSRSGVKTRG